MKNGRGVRQGCCLSLIEFSVYREYLTKEALEGFGNFKIGGKVICTMKHVDELVLLINRLISVFYGMVMWKN